MQANAMLWQAFRQAHYQVELPEQTVRLQLDRPAPDLDGLLGRHGLTVWALLQAGFPRSAPWPERLNQSRLKALEQQLDRRGLTRWPASGSAPDGCWEELGVLTLLPSLRLADALACRFGQHAIVCAQRGEPAALRCYGPAWRAVSKPSDSTASGGPSSG